MCLVPALFLSNRLSGGRFSKAQNASCTKLKYLLVNINCRCKKWIFAKNSATEYFYCYFSISPSQLQTFTRFDSCSSAKTLAGSGALSAEDAVSLSLPYSAEMLWQSISQGDAVSMATPHCKISKLDFFFFSERFKSKEGMRRSVSGWDLKRGNHVH